MKGCKKKVSWFGIIGLEGQHSHRRSYIPPLNKRRPPRPVVSDLPTWHPGGLMPPLNQMRVPLKTSCKPVNIVKGDQQGTPLNVCREEALSFPPAERTQPQVSSPEKCLWPWRPEILLREATQRPRGRWVELARGTQL